MANTYYLRCVAADVPELLRLGEKLGVLQTGEDGIVRGQVGSSWDVIGPIFDVEGNSRKNTAGEEYWHANLRTDVDLRDAAEQLATVEPEIAAGLADLSRFFVTDAEGRAIPPMNPARVFL